MIAWVVERRMVKRQHLSFHLSDGWKFDMEEVVGKTIQEQVGRRHAVIGKRERERREEIQERSKLSKRESFGVGSTDIRIVESTAVRMRRTDSSTSFLTLHYTLPRHCPRFLHGTTRSKGRFPWAQYALSQPKRCTIHLSFSNI